MKQAQYVWKWEKAELCDTLLFDKLEWKIEKDRLALFVKSYTQKSPTFNNISASEWQEIENNTFHYGRLFF